MFFKRLVIVLFLCFFAGDCFADSALIKGVAKMRRTNGYLIVINYETRDRLTDDLFFRVHCKFKNEEFAYICYPLRNIKKGLHRVELRISDASRKEYGSLMEYKVELYKEGALAASKASY